MSTLALLFGGCSSVLYGQPAPGQPTPATTPDVLLFTDGEKLTGHFVSSSGSSLTFKSDVLGNITVDWSKVKELQSSAKVAVIPKGVRLRKPADAATVATGTLSVEDQQVHLLAEPPKTIPIGDTGEIVDETGFEKAIAQQPGFFHAWQGNVTLGAAVVEATQDNETFTGAVNLSRAIPAEGWLEPRNRTLLNLNASYGEVMQPGTPTIITSIFHGDAERDEYFSPRLYVFGQGAFDHNYSQGLDLQQTYSGGIGFTVIQQPNQTLDLKASASFVRQELRDTPMQNLFGSIFGESYDRKFKRFTFDQHITLIPTWNKTNDYSAVFNALVTIPVYKRLGGSAGFVDSFLNDPAPGFRKNSAQVTLGITYAMR